MPPKYRDIEEGLTSYVYIGTFIFLLLAALFIIFLLVADQKKKRLQREKLEITFKFQQTLLESQLEIQEQTLKNISQEIHDNIGQALTLAKLNLNTVLPTATGQTYDKLINSKELVSKAIGDLRDLSRSLDTDYVKEMGLQRAIEYELEMMQKTGTIHTTIQVEGSVIRLDKQKELILFRIVQETFHNIIKHAEAKNLQVEIFYKPNVIILQIADDGKGVDLTPLTEGDNSSFGLGIRNMHNRSKLIGAEFNMSSTLGKGTRVQIILPLENTNHENKL